MNKYSKILRQLRSSPKLWEAKTEVQTQRLIEKCKDRLSPVFKKQAQRNQDRVSQRHCDLYA